MLWILALLEALVYVNTIVISIIIIKYSFFLWITIKIFLFILPVPSNLELSIFYLLIGSWNFYNGCLIFVKCMVHHKKFITLKICMSMMSWTKLIEGLKEKQMTFRHVIFRNWQVNTFNGQNLWCYNVGLNFSVRRFKKVLLFNCASIAYC